MKFLTVAYRYIRHNIAPIFLTVVFITVSMFGILTLYGQYRYTSYNRDCFAESGFEDALYFMPMAADIWIDGDPTAGSRIYNELSVYGDAIEVITYRHYYGTVDGAEFDNVYIYGDGMIESFRLPVDEGRWLDASAESAEIVLAGTKWSDVTIGETVKLTDGGDALVVGKINSPVNTPDFNSGSNSDVAADHLYKLRESGIFATEHVTQKIAADRQINDTVCFFVRFCGGADAATVTEITDYLMSRGKLVGYEKIIEDSNVKIDEWIKKALPLPMFMLAIATINIICISAITVKRSMNESSRYFLVGCSTRRSIFTISATMAASFSFPTVFNILSVSFFPNFLREDSYSAIDYMLDASCSWIALLYMLIVVLIVTLIPIVLYRKYSPLEFYRRQI